MSIYSLLPLFTAVYIIFLGIFVYLNNRKSTLNITLASGCFSAFVWLIGYAIMYSIKDESIAVILAKLLYVGVIFIPVTYHHFTMKFLKREKEGRVIVGIYMLGVTFVLADFFSKDFISGVNRLYWGYQTKVGPLHAVFLVFVFGTFIKCLYNLYVEHKINIENKSQADINRIKYVFWAFFLGNIGAIDFMPNYGVEFYPIGSINIAVFNSVIVYAIFRHHLLDIEVVIKKTLVFAGLFAIVFGVFVGITVLAQELLGFGRILGLALSSLVIMFTVRPLENFLINITDKFLFQKKYDYRELLRKFKDSALEYKDMDKLLPKLTEDLSDIMKIESCVILIHDEEKKEFRIGSYKGKVDSSAAFTDDNPLIRFLNKTHAYILKDEIIRKLPDSDKLKESLRRLDAEVVFPLMLHDDVIGAIGFSAKKSGEIYTHDDINILDSVCFSLGTAISNSKLISEMLIVQAEAEQNSKMAAIGTLSAGINHEICNPLGIARGQCESFLLNMKDGIYKDKVPQELIDKALVIMGKVIHEVDRATDTTKRLSNFAKPSTGIISNDVDLKHELEEVTAFISYETKMDRIDIVKEIDDNLPFISADRKALQEVFFNLLRNAAQAIKEKGTITVRAKERNEKIIIEIEDTGEGIPEDKIGLIFNPFYTTKGPKGGTGLGLFIVYQMVRRNKGKISIKSKVGEGTTITLEFPRYVEKSKS